MHDYPEMSPMDVQRLREIKDEILELMHEAKNLIPRNTQTYARFTAYPYGNIMSMLDSENEYGNPYNTTLETIAHECEQFLHSDYQDED